MLKIFSAMAMLLMVIRYIASNEISVVQCVGDVLVIITLCAANIF